MTRGKPLASVPGMALAAMPRWHVLRARQPGVHNS
jgi:hypothetical protein